MKHIVIFSLFILGFYSKIKAQTPTTTSNYIMLQVPSEPTETAIGDHTKLRTSISYIDGLGRTTQQILYKAGGAGLKDIVNNHQTFDKFGRTDKTFTDYGNAGLGAISSVPSTIFSDTAAYSKVKEYDNSPLNRPTKIYGVGQAWRSAAKFTKMKYNFNGSDIRYFNILDNGTISASGFYNANSLYSKTFISEREFSTTEYTDNLGRTVAKVQQIDASKFLTTAYVYDDFGRLAYVIPPKAYKKFGTNSGQVTSFTEADNLFLEGIYAYHFDDRGRQIEKHIPGAGWTYYVYDKHDRLVMENDEKDAGDNFWKFTKYDALGRVIMTGIRTGIGSTPRWAIQYAFDSHTGNTFEQAGSELFGYTNVSFPANYPIFDIHIKTVTYYDNYDWQTDGLYDFQSTNAFSQAQGSSTGLVTGALTRNCETDDWYKSVNYYDYKARNIQSFNQNHKGGLNRSDTEYSFTNEVVKLRLVHQGITEIYEYTLDHMGRKTDFKHTKDGLSKNIAKYTYDEVGRMETKILKPSGGNYVGSEKTGNWVETSTWSGGNLPTINDVVTINAGHNITVNNGETVDAGLLVLNGIVTNNGTVQLGSLGENTAFSSQQSIDYKYHIRGGLKGINLDASGNLTNSIFSYKLGYEEDATYFDGNIRKQEWRSNLDNVTRSYTYDYDGGSRILSGAYESPGTEKYSLNSVTYDENGGITGLSRDGKKSNNTFGLVDNLEYTYFDYSNKIKKVTDNSLETASFTDDTGENDYTYYEDGSLKSDANKKITLIEYNYLKLPKKIVIDGKTIENQYDARGTKLKETIGTNVTDYETNLIYKNNVLMQLSHDEGRIASDVYEYNIKDHLGNLRVSFKDSAGIAKITQSNAYGVWGENLPSLSFKNTPNLDNFKYTGKEELAETGYIDFGARLFDNVVPRFTTVDPLADQREWLTPYNMAQNNPINRIDPDGALDEPVGGDIGMMIGAAVIGIKHSFMNLVYNAGDGLGITPAGAGMKWQASQAFSEGENRYVSVMNKVPMEGIIKDTGGHLLDGLNAATGLNPASGTTTGLLAKAAPSATIVNEVVQTAKTAIHANSKASDKLNTLYRLEIKTGEYLKTGVASKTVPEKRYSNSYMLDKVMVPLDKGSRTNMLSKERSIVETNPGPLNKEPWAGKQQR